jgi:hypothetical protein
MNRFKCVFCFVIYLTFNSAIAQQDTVIYNQERGFSFGFNVGLMTHSPDGDNAKYGLTVNHITTYKFGRFLQIGLGIGFDDYDYFQALPITLHYSGELLKSESGPFYFVSGGYAHMWEIESYSNDVIEGGMVFNAGGGYSWKVNKVKISVYLAYKRQELKSNSTPYYAWYSYKETTQWTLNRTEFKVGISF